MREFLENLAFDSPLMSLLDRQWFSSSILQESSSRGLYSFQNSSQLSTFARTLLLFRTAKSLCTKGRSTGLTTTDWIFHRAWCLREEATLWTSGSRRYKQRCSNEKACYRMYTFMPTNFSVRFFAPGVAMLEVPSQPEYRTL